MAAWPCSRTPLPGEMSGYNSPAGGSSKRSSEAGPTFPKEGNALAALGELDLQDLEESHPMV